MHSASNASQPSPLTLQRLNRPRPQRHFPRAELCAMCSRDSCPARAVSGPRSSAPHARPCEAPIHWDFRMTSLATSSDRQTAEVTALNALFPVRDPALPPLTPAYRAKPMTPVPLSSGHCAASSITPQKPFRARDTARTSGCRTLKTRGPEVGILELPHSLPRARNDFNPTDRASNFTSSRPSSGNHAAQAKARITLFPDRATPQPPEVPT